jgi:hypothetical protein
MAHKPRTPEQLVPMLIDGLRRRRILAPSATVLEMIVHQARTRAESALHRALIEGLGTATRANLGRLLDKRPEETISYLAWLRSAQQSPAAQSARPHRTGAFRAHAWRRPNAAAGIPAQAFERLADKGLPMTAQHLRDLRAQHRHAALCATVIKLESLLTDGPCPCSTS